MPVKSIALALNKENQLTLSFAFLLFLLIGYNNTVIV